jgi:hypothetical protein
MRRWHRSVHCRRTRCRPSISGIGASGVMASNTTYSAPPAVSASVRSFEQAQLGDDAVGDDEDLAVTEAGDGLSQPAAGTRPDQDRRLRYGQEAHGQAGAFHQGAAG